MFEILRHCDFKMQINCLYNHPNTKTVQYNPLYDRQVSMKIPNNKVNQKLYFQK